MPVTKASTPNQLKQTQSGILQKIYAHITKEKPIMHFSSEKPWTEVKYAKKKRGMAQNQAQK